MPDIFVPHELIDVDEADASVQDWYQPGPSMTEFHQSRVKIRALIGGRGTGKTTGVAVETIRHSFHNAGAKTYALRKTQLSNEDTTLDTFEEVFKKTGTAYQESSISLFKKIDGGKSFRMPSRRAIELFNQFMFTNPTKVQTVGWLDSVGNKWCSWVQFAGVPTKAMRGSRFRGYECSMLVFVEADQLEEEDLELGQACLRWKGADRTTCTAKGYIRDSCVILDTNPPGLSHWLAKMEKERASDKTVKFWHIPTEENRHNLPDDYIETLQRAYARKPAMYARMLEGQYADAFEGEPVLFGFSQEHVRDRLDWPRGAYLVRSWDFGTKQATIFSAYWSVRDDASNKEIEYWWDLFEFYAEQSDTERQCREVISLTNTIFPDWNDRDICSGIKDFCDIAGRQNTATGSSLKILNSYKIYPGFKKMGLQQSLAIYNRLLQKKDPTGHVVYMIDRNACPRLYRASMGGYRYPMVGEPGYGSDEPLKDGHYDHVADASRYGKVNCMRLLVTEDPGAKGLVGKLSRKISINPKKRWW